MTVECCVRSDSGVCFQELEGHVASHLASQSKTVYEERELPVPVNGPFLGQHLEGMRVVDLARPELMGRPLLCWDVHWQARVGHGVERHARRPAVSDGASFSMHEGRCGGMISVACGPQRPVPLSAGVGVSSGPCIPAG